MSDDMNNSKKDNNNEDLSWLYQDDTPYDNVHKKDLPTKHMEDNKETASNDLLDNISTISDDPLVKQQLALEMLDIKTHKKHGEFNRKPIQIIILIAMLCFSITLLISVFIEIFQTRLGYYFHKDEYDIVEGYVEDLKLRGSGARRMGYTVSTISYEMNGQTYTFRQKSFYGEKSGDTVTLAVGKYFPHTVYRAKGFRSSWSFQLAFVALMGVMEYLIIKRIKYE